MILRCYSVGPNVPELDRAKCKEHLDKLENKYAAFKEAFPEAGMVHVDTCNRVEIYISARREIDPRALFATLNLDDQCAKLFETIEGKEVVDHLFSVASGLKSNAFGETGIAGQIRSSYQTALETGATDRDLNLIFQRAQSVQARVKNETGLGGISVSTEALAVKKFDEIASGRKVILLGTGESAMLLMHQLIARAPEKIVLASSSTKRAAQFLDGVDENGQHRFKLDDSTLVECVEYGSAAFTDAVNAADAIFSATTARNEPLVRASQLLANVQIRRQLLLVADLSSPAVIESVSAGYETLERHEAIEQLADLDKIVQITIDDLKTQANEAEAQKRALLPAAAAIISEEVDRLLGARVVGDFNAGLSKVVACEVDKALEIFRLSSDKIARRTAEKVANALVHPLRGLVRENVDDEALIQKLNQAFGIE